MNLSDISYLINYDMKNLYNINKYQYIFFDTVSDVDVKNSTAYSDAPIDAIKGTSLQERKDVGMITLGMTVSFSDRYRKQLKINSSRDIEILFNYNSPSRLSNIVDWFEKALEDCRIFTVCKRGIIYHNQLLNNIEWSFGESNSVITASLSFIEVEMLQKKTDNSIKRHANILNKANVRKPNIKNITKSEGKVLNALDIFE